MPKWQCENMMRAPKDSGYKYPVYNFHDGNNSTETKHHIKKDLLKLVDVS